MASRSQPRLLSTAIFHRFVFLSRSFSSISDLRSCMRQPDLSFLTINSFRTAQMAQYDNTTSIRIAWCEDSTCTRWCLPSSVQASTPQRSLPRPLLLPGRSPGGANMVTWANIHSQLQLSEKVVKVWNTTVSIEKKLLCQHGRWYKRGAMYLLHGRLGDLTTKQVGLQLQKKRRAGHSWGWGRLWSGGGRTCLDIKPQQYRGTFKAFTWAN